MQDEKYIKNERNQIKLNAHSSKSIDIVKQ